MIFYISSENNDFDFISFKKYQFFQFFSHFTELGSKFDLGVKYVKDNLGSSFRKNSVGLTYQMLHTKSQGHWPSGSGEEEF